MPDRIRDVPNFGLFHLNLEDAGMLIAKCLWFRGDFEVSFERSESIDFDNGELTAALESQAVKFTKLLCRAVKSGTLEAAEARLDLQDNVQTRLTFVDAMLAAQWLEQRGIVLGDVFEDEYLAKESELAERILQIVVIERSGQHHEQDGDPENLFLRHELAKSKSELISLKTADPGQATITEKQKNAYLNVIGALLGLLLGKSPSGMPYSQFQNQQAVIDGIQANFGAAPGLSLRNLQDKFAEAKRMLIASVWRDDQRSK